MVDLVVALGLAMTLEGIAYTLFPDAMKRLMAQILAHPSHSLRSAGLVAVVFGVMLVWMVKG
ncbi:MAG: DUF2065 domain-containing protein [Rhodospirillales bacterium]|nr:DUF2065 domain-containing protein [Rhodospirillales bacterium]